MTLPELSPALLEILNRRDEVSRRLDEALHEYRSSNESEAILNAQYERQFAEAFLRAEGPQKERECHAKLAASTTYKALQMAIALRRSGRGALAVGGSCASTCNDGAPDSPIRRPAASFKQSPSRPGAPSVHDLAVRVASVGSLLREDS